LHVQLEAAIAYAHKKAVVLKADLPIGVGRHSADTWEYGNLFVMGMQAGAPPDAFSGSGQNWSFPTYNFNEMAKDGYAWFRKRMQHLQTYFDAVRIDHVLGIFRIWSIPTNQVEGTMGRFVPAIPMNRDEFNHVGLHFDENRFCKPFITDDILYEKFGNDTTNVKNIFFSNGQFKHEFDDQRKIENHFINNPENIRWQQGLFDLICNVLLFKEEHGYHFRINMHQISSFKSLSAHEKSLLDKLYHKYFFVLQNNLWKHEGEIKLQMMTESTDMLLCAEDLGMVPDFTEEVLKNLDILSLQVQQMPKDSASSYSDTEKAKYESIVMPATHDMSPMRLWWEENRETTQSFYNDILHEYGKAPHYCEPWVCKKIVEKHLQSPAMWSIFLMQDILALNGEIRLENPADERINVPANPNHVWNYRMHISIEDLMKQQTLNDDLKAMIKGNGR
jgi:4-alpha-glucanotransferase